MGIGPKLMKMKQSLILTDSITHAVNQYSQLKDQLTDLLDDFYSHVGQYIDQDTVNTKLVHQSFMNDMRPALFSTKTYDAKAITNHYNNHLYGTDDHDETRCYGFCCAELVIAEILDSARGVEAGLNAELHNRFLQDEMTVFSIFSKPVKTYLEKNGMSILRCYAEIMPENAGSEGNDMLDLARMETLSMSGVNADDSLPTRPPDAGDFYVAFTMPGYELFIDFVNEHFGNNVSEQDATFDLWDKIKSALDGLHASCFSTLVGTHRSTDSYIQIGGYPSTIQGDDDMDLIVSVDTQIGDGGCFLCLFCGRCAMRDNTNVLMTDVCWCP